MFVFISSLVKCNYLLNTLILNTMPPSELMCQLCEIQMLACNNVQDKRGASLSIAGKSVVH